MKKRAWCKPWYIWSGPLAFSILFHVSLHTIDKKETRLKIGYPRQRDLRRKVWKFFFLFGVFVFTIPGAAIMLLIEWLSGDTENFILNSLLMLYGYAITVYGAYRHTRWRDENLADLLNPQKSEALDEPQEDGG